jgi:hypothetical protein
MEPPQYAGGSGAAPPKSTNVPQRNQTESGSSAVICLRAEDITCWVLAAVAKMPRDHKFALGDKWVEACLEVTCVLVEATYVRDKLVLLAHANRGLTRARVLARMANRLKLVSGQQLAHFDRESVEIGRMIGGWTRSIHRR